MRQQSTCESCGLRMTVRNCLRLRARLRVLDAHEERCWRHLPRLALPKKRPDLVEEDGGGGFWICDAVGARDWRIEYVRCMAAVCVIDETMRCWCR